MSAVILVFEFIILAAACVWLLHHYASLKKTPWYALVSTWLGWLLCFSIVFLIPIDILNMDYDDCVTDYNNRMNSTHPTTNITLLDTAYSYSSSDDNSTVMDCNRPITSLPDSYMQKQWAVLWWGTMILSWLGFPLLSSFFQAGHFTTWERCVRALKENVVLYCVLGVIGVIAVLVLWKTSGLTQAAFLSLMLSLANAYGLVLTVILMGYGLVDIPRYLWRKANRAETLRYYCVMAFKYKEGIEHAKADLLKTLKVVKSISDKVNDHDPYRPYVDVILSKCPGDFGEVSGEGDVELTYGKLVAVHQKVRDDTHNVARAVCLYEQMLKKAFKTEDVMRTRTHKQPEWKIYWSFIPARTHRFAKFSDAWEYLWQVYLFTSILRLFAVFFGILSILIVWSEITLTADSHNLSPFAHMLTGIPLKGFARQLFCLVVIFYMALCAYTTLFKIKLFNFYRLVPHQMSDAGSIMFSSNYLCRLAAPLAYNFLSIVHINDKNFIAVMGDMAATGLGRDFMIGFPVLVIILCLAAVFNVYSKIGAMCCIKRFRYRPDDDEMLVDAGEKILAEARETKEGRGPVQMTTKETIKSSIRDEVRDVSKLAHNKSENGLYENEQRIQMQQEVIVVPPIPEATPAPPATLHSAMASKYGINTRQGGGQGDLLPPTSRFAKRKNSLDPSSAAAAAAAAAQFGGMRHNRSANDLAAAESGSFSSMRPNLSNNNLSGQAPPPAPTSTLSKFLSIKPPSFTTPTSNPNTPTITPTITPSIKSATSPSMRPNSSTPSPSSSSSSSRSYEGLLPPNSRFAQRAPSHSPAPPSAILVTPPPDSDSFSSPSPSSSSSGKQGDTKSLLGGLFGKPKFELLPSRSPSQNR